MQKKIEDLTNNEPFKILYVSNILPYKYHENVILAFEKIIELGFPVSLTLIGKIDFPSIAKKINKMLKRINKDHNLIKWYQNINIEGVKKFYHDSD